jgi:hypothetical protein
MPLNSLISSEAAIDEELHLSYDLKIRVESQEEIFGLSMLQLVSKHFWIFDQGINPFVVFLLTLVGQVIAIPTPKILSTA